MASDADISGSKKDKEMYVKITLNALGRYCSETNQSCDFSYLAKIYSGTCMYNKPYYNF